jgi:hypothetical protein
MIHALGDRQTQHPQHSRVVAAAPGLLAFANNENSAIRVRAKGPKIRICVIASTSAVRGAG